MSKKKQKIDGGYYISLIERITTLHGTNHFTSKTGKSLILWTLAVIGNMILTVAFIMVIKQKFNESQIVTAINANCRVNQVPFPSVSICNLNMVSLKESQNIARVLKHYNKSDAEIQKFFNALPELKSFGKSSRQLGNFSDIMQIMKHHFFTVDTIMEEVHQKCENLMLYCAFNRKPKNCIDMFILVKTYEGHCCTFNYAALNDASEVSLLPQDNDMEYYDDQNPDGDETSTSPTILATSESGRRSGLSVVFNVEPNDYPSWSPIPYYGVKCKMSKKKQKIDGGYYISLIERITTLHGTNHFTSKTGKSLILWTLAVIGNMILTVAFIMVIKQKFNESQIVTAINANCRVNQVPFPSVSICNLNMVSLKESQNIARVLKHYNKSDAEIQKFFNALPELKSFGKSSRQLGNFSDIMQIMKHHFFTVDTIMEEVHQKCENLMLYCAFNRKPKNCIDMFILVKTYEGHCCTFNYAALNDASEVSLLPQDNDMEYYDDQNPDGDETSTSPTILATSESGRRSGLSVVFNVEPNDYPSWSPIPYYGVKVIINDPNDYPETTVLYRYITLGESVDIKVVPMVFQSDSNIRTVDPEKRACVFHDEVHLGYTNRYSYETCCTECKMKNYLEACKCVPYKYPREKTTRICDFEDLRCLNNVTVHKSNKEMLCNPVCFIECRDKKYSITSNLTPFLPDDYQGEYAASVNVSELAALQVFYDKSTCNCYKMTLLIDLSYFIATYGGVFSLSFGGSIITLVEITYLFISFVITGITIVISRSKLNSL